MEDKELLANVMEELENTDKNYLKTGFVDFDGAIGIRQGELVIIGGRPAMGKTAFLLSMLTNFLKNNYKCLYFSLEMSKEQVIKRLLCQNAEIPAFRMRLGEFNDKDWEKIYKIIADLSEYDLWLEDTCSITVKDIEEQIIKHQTKVVFIDYLQLIASNSNCKVQKYKNIIIYLPNFNEWEEGFLKELIVFLKSMNKKVTVISRSKNCTSFANYLNKMCNFINVVDLDDFYTRLYPRISILELE